MKKISFAGRNLFSHKYFPILLLLILNLIVGALVVADYGESRDEYLRFRYAYKSINAYLGTGKIPHDIEKGPFYVMVAFIGSKALALIFKDWLRVDSWHYMHFLSFQLGLFFLYRICMRYMDKWAAFGAVLLFNTQPLLWGHSFINPKDIPFMSFFLASLDMGMAMSDSPEVVLLADNKEDGQVVPFRPALGSKLAEDWGFAAQKKRVLLAGAGIFSLVLLLGLSAARPAVHNLVAQVIQSAYSASPEDFLGILFSRFAEGSGVIPIELYLHKGLSMYSTYLNRFAILVVVFNLLIFWSLFPRSVNYIWSRFGRKYWDPLRINLKTTPVILGGVFLGFCGAIRVAGPISGGLASMYFLLKSGRKAIPALASYFGIGLAVTYILWPGLWSAPFQGFSDKIATSLDFPWDGKVLFAGTSYEVDALPRTYLPAMLPLQFTEVVLALFIAGLAAATVKSINGSLEWKRIAVITVWLFAPIIAVVLFKPTIYDNFRQLLFIIPPIFVFTGIGLQVIINRIKNPLVTLLLIALLVIPGVYWDLNLHPYQYVYYNNIVGGVRGAFRSYEMDYWQTSYREAADYLNSIAPANANIIVWGADHLVKTFARPDLQVEQYRSSTPAESYPDGYVVISTRHDKDINLFPDARILLRIERDEATLAVVKELASQGDPSDY